MTTCVKRHWWNPCIEDWEHEDGKVCKALGIRIQAGAFKRLRYRESTVKRKDE